MVNRIPIVSHVRGQGKSARILRSVLILVALMIAAAAHDRISSLSKRVDALELAQATLELPEPVQVTLYRMETLAAVPIVPVRRDITVTDSIVLLLDAHFAAHRAFISEKVLLYEDPTTMTALLHEPAPAVPIEPVRIRVAMEGESQ